jgi:hypothetical protein
MARNVRIDEGSDSSEEVKERNGICKCEFYEQCYE